MQAANAFCMSSHWFLFTKKRVYQRVFPILLVPSSESDDSFTWQFSFTDTFEIQGSLTLFFPMFPFDPPENIRKPLVF